VDSDLKTEIDARRRGRLARRRSCLAAAGWSVPDRRPSMGPWPPMHPIRPRLPRLVPGKGPEAFKPADSATHCRRFLGAGAADRPVDASACCGWRKGVMAGAADWVLHQNTGLSVADLATAGLDTVAVSGYLSHPVAREILRRFGARWWRSRRKPVRVTSRRPRPATCWQGDSSPAGIDLIVDGGAVAVGVESTLSAVSETPICCLRPRRADARRHRKRCSAARSGNRPRMPTVTAASRSLAPGMLASHYAPRTRVRSTRRESSPMRAPAGVRQPSGFREFDAQAAGDMKNLSR